MPLAITFASNKTKVVGFDIDESKLKILKEGKSYIKQIDNGKIKSLFLNKFECTSDFKKISKMDAIIICVPTPLNSHREPDLSYIRSTINSILPYLRKGQLISLESTTYPGTTDDEIVSVIENNGFKVGKDFYVVYSPEREDPGNVNFSTSSIPKIIGGTTKKCLKYGLQIYSKAIKKMVPVESTKEAEMAKLLENIYRAVNIGMVNEMKVICDKMGIDIYNVIDAAATKPFGFTPYYPGPGLGGHCIPVDPFYLSWKAKEFGISSRFIELAGEVNASMPDFVIGKY